ncbi:hypothetical protein MIND_00463200 [Mycena indigotica]|uniref:Copper acquisition factor BIM1-like domain-containing protein n=1 Tax=Mycena indigotica TaxID=2126181 RepID=A0A8H6SZG3_9AGAR|nr:uncharacterized protein MIND_00463200 [Mycena indigotica]KAF7306715.1 hypothetical protein MIND_00463200 [Mycena indigotica]
MLASVVFASLIVAANAHFQLQFPAPRGPFVEDDEPKFCDGHDDPASRRTFFPLSGGVISLNSEHAKWVAVVSITSKSDPTQFSDFAPVTGVLQASGEGLFCLPFDLSKTNATGLADGQNATLQIQFNGGDSDLFQCADITLSSSVTSPPCSNGTGVASASLSPAPSATRSASGSGSSGAPGGSSARTSPSSSPSPSNPPSAGERVKASIVAVVVGLLGIAAAVA